MGRPGAPSGYALFFSRFRAPISAISIGPKLNSPAGRLDQPLTREIAEGAFPPQRQRTDEAADQAGEIVVVAPGRQGEGLEAPGELVVGAQRVARRLRTDADERNPQLVAEKAQHVQKSRLFAHRAGAAAAAALFRGRGMG